MELSTINQIDIEDGNALRLSTLLHRTPPEALQDGDISALVVTFEADVLGGKGSTYLLQANHNGGRIDVLFEDMLAGREWAWKAAYGDIPSAIPMVRQQIEEGRASFAVYTLHIGAGVAVRNHTTDAASKLLSYDAVRRVLRAGLHRRDYQRYFEGVQ